MTFMTSANPAGCRSPQTTAWSGWLQLELDQAVAVAVPTQLCSGSAVHVVNLMLTKNYDSESDIQISMKVIFSKFRKLLSLVSEISLSIKMFGNTMSIVKHLRIKSTGIEVSPTPELPASEHIAIGHSR